MEGTDVVNMNVTADIQFLGNMYNKSRWTIFTVEDVGDNKHNFDQSSDISKDELIEIVILSLTR